MKRFLNFSLIILSVICVAGCMRMTMRTPSGPAEVLLPVSADSIDWSDDLDVASLALAIERSLKYYDSPTQNNVYHVGDRLVDTKQMKESLIAFHQIIKNGSSIEDSKEQIRRDFDIYRATGVEQYGGVLFTGYYVPLLEGSLQKTNKYKYPIYKTPPDLLTNKISRNETKINLIKNGEAVAYYGRRDIDVDGVLQNKNLEIVWVTDPVDLFFLHIQGSGKIKLEDGNLLTVGVAQTNGRPYRSMPNNLLDKIRRDKGNASYANVKAWLKNKSDEELYGFLGYYDRYIFFRFVDKEPVGSLGQPVTSSRSIATDPDFFPPGALAFIRLTKPVFDAEGNIKERVPFSRFVLNQDKGSAIKGPGRVDLFCGFGTHAEATAGSLKEKGELYFLLKK